MADWDMVIFEGKSPKPVYLHIENDKAELLDASDLWGRSFWETEPAITMKHQDPQFGFLVLGALVKIKCCMRPL